MKMELINGNLLESLGAGLGILSYPKINYIRTDQSGLDALIAQRGFGVFVCASSQPGFFQKGIARRTKSWAQHAGIICSYDWAVKIRKENKELLKNRRIPNTTTEAGLLPPVPQPILGQHEIIESQMRVSIKDVDSTVRDGEQGVIFFPKYTQEQISAILKSVYFMYGAPYDIFEIGNWLWKWMPNFKQIYVCSSLVANSVSTGDENISLYFKTSNVDLSKAAPGHIGQYYFFQGSDAVAFGCGLIDAKSKI